MDSQAAQLGFDFYEPGPIILQPAEERLTSDAGLLAVRQFDHRWRFTERFAAALVEPRVRHRQPLLDMVRQRVFGILAGYEDCNDHDRLNDEPLFKLLTGRKVDGPALASQPTLSRFENAVPPRSLFALEALHLDTGLERLAARHEAQGTGPCELTFDLDAFDDPTHGRQQLALFHGYYDQYQYLPLVVTEASTRHVFAAFLRHGTAHAALGADDTVRQIVAAVHRRWPRCRLHFRADSAFGVPSMFAACEADPLVSYSFGLIANPRLQAWAEPLLARARQHYAATGVKPRFFAHCRYRAESWDRDRLVVAKAECGPEGSNLRFIVTDHPCASDADAEARYDAYIQRGTSEQRIDELKNELCADRLSCHRFLGNSLRLHLHVAAYNLLAGLRDHAAVPEPLRAARIQVWRTRLLKLAARVQQSTRRVLLLASAHWPFWDLLRTVSLRSLLPVPAG